MRTSALQFKTLRETPQDAEAISHQILVRGNYFRRLTSGVYHFLPLGYRLVRGVRAIIEEEFDAVGASEILLPALQPVEIWEASGRRTKMADVLFTIESKSGSFVLGPTHEEAVIEALSPDLSRYRDLPAIVYQIQTKFRDEPRARFGLMRTREFIMADAYSFDRGRSEMEVSYELLFDAYKRIFARLGLLALPVEADSGAIGGDVSHEFMVASAIGEDHFALCVSCGYRANIEAATLGELPPIDVGECLEPVVYRTPDAPGVLEAVAALRGQGALVDETAMLKCMVTLDGEDRPVLCVIPGDRTLLIPSGLRLAPAEFLRDHGFFVQGYVGPQGMAANGVRVIADPSIGRRQWWATGANEVDHHIVGVRPGIDFVVDSYESLVVVVSGDPCPRCGTRLELVRAVEVGHTFQLETAYSDKLSQARFVDSDGSEQPYWMGCFGIGVTRILAVIAQQYALPDGHGVAWPVSVAPFSITIIPVGARESNTVIAEATRLYELLKGAGVEALLEDRAESTGVVMNDMELVGSPLWCVVGARSLAEGMIEVRNRLEGTTKLVPIDEVIGLAVQELERSALLAR
ncbi:MAG: proline--tRNA ligase [Ferrimicrobium sp.]